MAGKGTEAAGGVCPGAVGEPTTPRSVGAAGPTESNGRGADANDRAGSGEISRGAAFEDPSWSGCFDGTGVRAGHWRRRAVSLWQADRELSRSGSRGRFQWRTTAARAHQQTGECPTAFPPGGSGASDGTERSRVAKQVFPSGHAARTQDRQGGDGPQTRGSSLLDVAGWEYQQLLKFGPHAGQPGNRVGVQVNTV